jgi:hypothetical protein
MWLHWRIWVAFCVTFSWQIAHVVFAGGSVTTTVALSICTAVGEIITGSEKFCGIASVSRAVAAAVVRMWLWWIRLINSRYRSSFNISVLKIPSRLVNRFIRSIQPLRPSIRVASKLTSASSIIMIKAAGWKPLFAFQKGVHRSNLVFLQILSTHKH